MPIRHSRKHRANDPKALAARLPDELRSFDPWLYTDGGTPTGLIDYLTALTVHVEPHEPMPVVNAAGLSVADWYRTMLSRPNTKD